MCYNKRIFLKGGSYMSINDETRIAVKNLMFNYYRIFESGYDFMGLDLDPPSTDLKYVLSRKRIASTKELAVAPLEIGARNHLEFHHLVERRECKKRNISNDGYVCENGVILTPYSHDLLNLIRGWDKTTYKLISWEMSQIKLIADMEKTGYLDSSHIRDIHRYLGNFE